MSLIRDGICIAWVIVVFCYIVQTSPGAPYESMAPKTLETWGVMETALLFTVIALLPTIVVMHIEERKLRRK